MKKVIKIIRLLLKSYADLETMTKQSTGFRNDL